MLTMRKAKKRTLQLNAQLAQTLTEKGVEATADETTTALVDKVAEISAGSDSYYDAFWDDVLENGTKTNLSKMFNHILWNNITFKPKYDLCPTDASSMFNGCGNLDLEEAMSKMGRIFDTSNCITFTNMFAGGLVTRVPHLDLSKVGRVQGIFSSCQKLTTVKSVRLPPLEQQIKDVSAPFFYISFGNCKMLKDFKFTDDSVLGSTFQISSAPLTVESAKNIITHLANYAGTEYEFVHSVSFSSTTRALLEAEGETAPNGGTWADYIFSLGWNM